MDFNDARDMIVQDTDARDALVQGIKLIRRIIAVFEPEESEQKIKTSNNPYIKMVLLASRNENITDMLETIKKLHGQTKDDIIDILNLDVKRIDKSIIKEESKNMPQKEKTQVDVNNKKKLIIKAQFILNIPAEQSIEDFIDKFKYSELRDRKIDGFEIYNEQEELILLKRESRNFQLLSKFRIPNQDFWRMEFKGLCENEDQIPQFIIDDGIQSKEGYFITPDNPLENFIQKLEKYVSNAITSERFRKSINEIIKALKENDAEAFISNFPI